MKSILLLSLISMIKLTTASIKKISQDMSLIPITRDELKQLKIKADEEKRKAEITSAIKELYDMIVQRATGSTVTTMQFKVIEVANMSRMNAQQQQQYRHQYFLNQQQSLTSSIIITDELRGDVVSGLRQLFPDSKIDYKVVAQAPDGKMYDVSKMDATLTPFIHSSKTNTVIDVDWS